MQQYTFLNTRELKAFREQVQDAFGHFPEKEYAYVQSEKGKIFLISKDLARIDVEKLRIDRIGFYFAEIYTQQVRLSKEGAQLLFLDAQRRKKKLKNVVLLTIGEVQQYFAGRTLERDLPGETRFVILQYGHEVLGCALYKEKRIHNYLPKEYRREVIL